MKWDKDSNIIIIRDIKNIDILKKMIEQNKNQFKCENISSNTCLALKFTKKSKDSKLRIEY